MYFGTNLVKMDAKGRVAIPARHRDRLRERCGSRVAVTIHPTGGSCLWMYPWDEWETTAEMIASLPSLKHENAVLKHILFTNLFELELDGQGRILLPASHRVHAGLDANAQVGIVGMGKRFEIWSEAALEEQNAACLEAARQTDSEVSDSLQQLML
ncbi:division/cell wall cluster transcriptional repressor MraZ [Solemya velum gill symbiont]|uniref:Transcriptional regulator MraZ n=2 Tax=Solemya velum gill symbiont TaxID=2340 RepID=A0A0B0HFM0_SOVGS|nr:division/cell wall cluster transcriptional repressor MraZ [Solemya velum gill symbiont]KHF26266.1 mraZ protein [Solemya velum gill symbiont]OOY35974.1 division/cell wall cluster transcriptional repressor MraZ [Solemya velum gill symbiont]OOY38814.1 division/cell wall cluster transcriptional repressor MraZ [Solemya velum gill symbiont]OOY40743.1 division/cell wall cluster transcriptional repressor MraZ [Solemya velum gill symbiont]OOY43064.1 division/cell wall cluster transcriptional repress